MASQTAQQTKSAESTGRPKTSKYMDRALEVLEKFGVATSKDVQNELIRLLDLEQLCGVAYSPQRVAYLMGDTRRQSAQ